MIGIDFISLPIPMISNTITLLYYFLKCGVNLTSIFFVSFGLISSLFGTISNSFNVPFPSYGIRNSNSNGTVDVFESSISSVFSN